MVYKAVTRGAFFMIDLIDNRLERVTSFSVTSFSHDTLKSVTFSVTSRFSVTLRKKEVTGV